MQVKLWCDCPFWPDDGMCKLRDCSVCECPENEFPEPFKKLSKRSLPSDDLKCQEGKPQATVDRTLDSKAFRGWIEVDNPWTNDDETDNSNFISFPEIVTSCAFVLLHCCKLFYLLNSHFPNHMLLRLEFIYFLRLKFHIFHLRILI